MKRVLLDHCVPRPLRRHLPGFHIRTCHEEGWAALRNGELLVAAERRVEMAATGAWQPFTRSLSRSPRVFS